MAHDQANRYTVRGELSPARLGELTAMRKLSIEGNPEAYQLEVFRDLDRSRLKRELMEFHDSGLPLALQLNARFGGSLASEIAVIRLVECVDSNNQHSHHKLEIVDRVSPKSNLADDTSFQLMVERITKFEECTRYLHRKAESERARMVLLISRKSRFKKLRAKADKQLGKNKEAVQVEGQPAH